MPRSIFPRLQDLDWFSRDGRLPKTIIHHAPLLPNLRVLSVPRHLANIDLFLLDVLDLFRLLACHSSLRKLYLNFEDIYHTNLGQGIAGVIERNTQLNSLYLSEDFMTSTDVSEAIWKHPNLTELTLEENEEPGIPKEYPFLLPSLTKLTFLNAPLPAALHLLQPCSSTSLTTISIVSLLPLENMWSMSKTLITIIGNECPALEKLEIAHGFDNPLEHTNSHSVPGSALHPLRSCRELQVVSIQFHLGYTDPWDDDIFSLRPEFNLGDDDFEHLLANWPKLVLFEFDIGSMIDPTIKQLPRPRATCKTLIHFAKNCPMLQELQLALDLSTTLSSETIDSTHSLPDTMQSVRLQRSWIPTVSLERTRLAYALWQVTRLSLLFLVEGPSHATWSGVRGLDLDIAQYRVEVEPDLQPSAEAAERFACWAGVEEIAKKLFLYEDVFLQIIREVSREDIDAWLQGLETHEAILDALDELSPRRHNRFRTWAGNRMEWDL